MGRPKTLLISRNGAFGAALRIIDAEGLEALTIRRIGEEMKVRGISLYHHFASKDEIVAGACRLALSAVRTPRHTDSDWREWIVENATLYWEALRKHPNLIPILMRRQWLGIGLDEHDRSAGLLAVQGVPLCAIVPLLEGLESLALGSAATEWTAAHVDLEVLQTRHPILYHATRQRGLCRADVFRATAGSIIDTILRQC